MKKFILILIISSVYIASAQDTIPISKRTLSEKIAKGNLKIKVASKNYESAKADFNQSTALFLPSITASHTGITTTNPLMAFGSKLNQEILTQADFNPALLNDPKHIENFSTVIELQQPIINLDGVYERKAARLKMEAYALQTDRITEYLQLEANKAYMQLQMAYKALEVLKRANVTARTNLKLVENYFAQGLLQKTDVLNVQVRVNEAENQLQLAQSNIQNASDYLAFLMNEDHTGTYKPEEGLDGKPAEEQFSAQLPASRKDIVAMEKSTEAYGKMLTSGKMAFLPRLNAFGNYQIYDGNIFGTSSKGYLLGAQLSWNVFDGYKSVGKMQKAKAEYQKSQIETEEYKKKSQLELDRTLRQLNDAQNKVKLSKLAWEQSDEAYHIRSNRFAQGLEKTDDLLMAETLSRQKELEYLQAVFEYNFTKQYLQFLTN